MLGPHKVGEGYSQASASSGMGEREMTSARVWPIFPFTGYRTPSSTSVMSILHKRENGKEMSGGVAQYQGSPGLPPSALRPPLTTRD